jgi:branched-subunit amino acid transport protein
VTSAKFKTSVKFMRGACPAALLAAVFLGSLAWSHGRYELVAVNAYIAGVNSVLTWIQWRWFKI